MTRSTGRTQRFWKMILSWLAAVVVVLLFGGLVGTIG